MTPAPPASIIAPSPPPSQKARRRGFSLVEIAIALGVISFTVVPLLALISQSFSVMNESNRDVQCALIAQKIIADSQMRPFTALRDQEIYMDIEGRPVPKREATLVASVSMRDETGLLPSQKLMRVTVTFSGTSLNGSPRIFSATLAELKPQ